MTKSKACPTKLSYTEMQETDGFYIKIIDFGTSPGRSVTSSAPCPPIEPSSSWTSEASDSKDEDEVGKSHYHPSKRPSRQPIKLWISFKHTIK